MNKDRNPGSAAVVWSFEHEQTNVGIHLITISNSEETFLSSDFIIIDLYHITRESEKCRDTVVTEAVAVTAADLAMAAEEGKKQTIVTFTNGIMK